MSQIAVGIAELAVGVGDLMLVTVGLGSCVAIVLHDADACVGALAHVLLPQAPQAANPSYPAHALSDAAPGKVAASAVPAMLERMRALGATGEVQARLIGGASMFTPLLPPGTASIGARNVDACRLACATYGVPIVGEAVGGERGRSVHFHVGTGRIDVRTVQGADVIL